MKTSADYQATPLTPAQGPPAAAGGAAAADERSAEAATAREGLPAGIARRTGIVFVHGIGTQQPAETFLDWSGPIVALLTDWRRDQEVRRAASLGPDEPVPPGVPAVPPDVIVDPVRRAAFSFNAASTPFLEVTIPAVDTTPETSWVFTEAWWAAELRAPDLGRTIDYLRRRIRTIVSGISDGYRSRQDNLLDMAADQGLLDRDDPPLSWRAIDLLDQGQAQVFGARPIGWTIGIAGTGLLAGYDLLRRVPIGPIRDFAARRMIDSFLVDWFGDLPALIDDPVQAANVRARLAGSIKALRDDGCDAVVLVAHSGGALVSFATLLDPAWLGVEYKVDKLITLGQGLGLAWRLAADPDIREIAPGHRLVGNLARVRPGLRWVDFWASYDPAPAGPLPSRGGLLAGSEEEPTDGPAAARQAAPQSAAVVETGEGPGGEAWLVRSDVGASRAVKRAASASARGATRAAAKAAGRSERGSQPVIEVESRPVTNEMNVLTDHGGYWANDEGFLVPLVRHIDAALGGAEASRFYRRRPDRTRRIIWRRQRVSALAGWDWLCSLVAIGSIAILSLGALSGGDRRLATAGEGVAAAWAFVPGHELLAGPIDGIGGLLQTIADAFGLGGATAWLSSGGPALLGGLLIALLYYVLARIGNGRWHAWDRRERILLRPEVPVAPDRRRVAGEAMALLGGLVALTLAVLTGSPGLVLAALAVGGLVGLGRWWSAELPPVAST